MGESTAGHLFHLPRLPRAQVDEAQDEACLRQARLVAGPIEHHQSPLRLVPDGVQARGVRARGEADPGPLEADGVFDRTVLVGAAIFEQLRKHRIGIDVPSHDLVRLGELAPYVPPSWVAGGQERFRPTQQVLGPRPVETSEPRSPELASRSPARRTTARLCPSTSPRSRLCMYASSR